MNQIQPIVAASLLLLFSGVEGAESLKPARAEASEKDLQGTWQVVSLEAQGAQGPKEVAAAMKLVFTGNTLTFVPGEPGFVKFTFKLDAAAKPAHFDMISVDGPDKGKAKKGIYLLNGDDLKICVGVDDRPVAFETMAESRSALYVLKRAKP